MPPHSFQHRNAHGAKDQLRGQPQTATLGVGSAGTGRHRGSARAGPSQLAGSTHRLAKEAAAQRLQQRVEQRDRHPGQPPALLLRLALQAGVAAGRGGEGKALQ